jgi:phosphotransferase system HPr (HPr) family protein
MNVENDGEKQTDSAIGSSRRASANGSMIMSEGPLRRNVVIRNPDGLHIRPAAAVAEAARRYQSQVTLFLGERRVDGRRIMDLIALGAEPGAELILEVHGPDAEEALEVLAEILASATPPPPPERPLPQKG